MTDRPIARTRMMNKACYYVPFCLFVVPSLSYADEPPRPNVLIIFTDDQGYADLACYGNTKNKTPRMDQLAKEGTRFTSFYSQTVCGPSRSALLTGRYPLRSKGWSMPAGEVTFAEALKAVGYETACIGKWDVSSRRPVIERMPNAQGFDYFFGPLGSNGSHVEFYENTEPAGDTKDMRNGKGSCYEGGYRLPCIVRWRGKVPAGRTSDAIFATIDFLPTLANLCGAELPAGRYIDGIDQTALLLGNTEEGRDHFFFDSAGVRMGKWKYLKANAAFMGYAREENREIEEELYDLDADIGETKNLASKYPEKVEELRLLYDSIKYAGRRKGKRK